MRIPSTANDVAEKFSGLTDERKAEILGHLRATPDEAGNRAVSQIIENGGDEARFVSQVFGKDVRADKGSPSNKKVNPIQTK